MVCPPRTELVRGYHFELAGSVQFPLPNEIFEDLGFDACPIYEPEIQSASIGPSGEPPILLYSDPEKLLAHLGEVIGLEAVLGMAEVAGWAEAPARALGRFEVRKPPKSLDEMWACASNEKEYLAIRTAMFGSVMDVVDQHPPRPREACTGPQHAWFSGCQLHVPRPLHARQCPLSRLCSRFTRRRDDVQGPGWYRSDVRPPARTVRESGGELRRHAKVSRIIARAGGSKESTFVTVRW